MIVFDRSLLLLLLFFCDMQRPHKAYPTELAQFHSADYVEFLHRITPNTQHLFANELSRCMYKNEPVTFVPQHISGFCESGCTILANALFSFCILFMSFGCVGFYHTHMSVK